MVMEPRFPETFDYINGFSLDDENTLPIFDQFPGNTSGYRFRDEPLDLTFLDIPPTPPPPPPPPNNDPATVNSFPGMASQLDSPDEFGDCVSNYLNQILMEENTSNQNIYHDSFTLQEYNQSRPYQPPSSTFSLNVESPEEITYGSSSEYSTHSFDSLETKSSVVTQTQTTDPMMNAQMVQNIFTDTESILLYKKSMEEASKFLPTIKPLVIDLHKYNLPSDNKVSVKVEKVELCNSNSNSNSPDGFRARKHHHLEDNDSEEDERSSKQSAVNAEEEAQLSAMFDRILICANVNAKNDIMPDCHSNNILQKTYNNWNAPSWRSATTGDNVDIRTLLINCAQSVANDDRAIASQQLKQISQHASTSGNATQRLAHYFALGLEARLSGTGYAPRKAVKISAAEKLKAYQAYVTSCPFKKNEVYFANRAIYEAGSSSSTVHIVDFGIAYGFQWPVVIKHLADRVGGPPKLKITGIDHPQPGFRPAERLEETGRRLAGYCHRFNIPFEYNYLAVQKWETIRVQDLKLERNEFLAVNALTKLHNLVDETVIAESPRDGVLKLIRDMKPDIFTHAIVDGSYNSPFFVTRFREALFHYSGLFDMVDETLERGNVKREDFEREFYGNEVMNVIACEGRERVQRPEGYKQWQVRNTRAGFKARRVNKEVILHLKGKVKMGYHKDFVFDDDGIWMLQGWKGRILRAVSSWVPA